jgi:putative ABC transport system substrate-binding protein
MQQPQRVRVSLGSPRDESGRQISGRRRSLITSRSVVRRSGRMYAGRDTEPTMLISLEVGVLVVFGSVTVRVAAEATQTTPIVAVDLETNPVNTGLAASFARPGGNVTGLFLDQPSLAGKWIELLREPRHSTNGRSVPRPDSRSAANWGPSPGRRSVAAEGALRRVRSRSHQSNGRSKPLAD